MGRTVADLRAAESARWNRGCCSRRKAAVASQYCGLAPEHTVLGVARRCAYGGAVT